MLNRGFLIIFSYISCLVAIWCLSTFTSQGFFKFSPKIAGRKKMPEELKREGSGSRHVACSTRRWYTFVWYFEGKIMSPKDCYSTLSPPPLTPFVQKLNFVMDLKCRLIGDYGLGVVWGRFGLWVACQNDAGMIVGGVGRDEGRGGWYLSE